MKNLLLSIIFLGIAGYVGLSLYNKWRDEGLGGSGSSALVDDLEFSFPAKVQIESVDGGTLSVRLIARNATHIQFERLTDGQRFVYPLTQLVSDSRKLVEAYPNVGLINAGEHVGEQGLELGDAYVDQLREGIRRIDEKIAVLNSDFGKTESKTAQRTIFRKIEGLQREKNELQSKIDERR